jgi:hypothetical protein
MPAFLAPLSPCSTFSVFVRSLFPQESTRPFHLHSRSTWNMFPSEQPCVQIVYQSRCASAASPRHTRLKAFTLLFGNCASTAVDIVQAVQHSTRYCRVYGRWQGNWIFVFESLETLMRMKANVGQRTPWASWTKRIKESFHKFPRATH